MPMHKPAKGKRPWKTKAQKDREIVFPLGDGTEIVLSWAGRELVFTLPSCVGPPLRRKLTTKRRSA